MTPDALYGRPLDEALRMLEGRDVCVTVSEPPRGGEGRPRVVRAIERAGCVELTVCAFPELERGGACE